MSDMRRMHSIPNGRYSMEMRSGKLLDVDEGFTQLLGYTDEDIKNGLIFKQLMPDVEYNEIIADLRAKFIESRFACYQHEMVTKDGKVLELTYREFELLKFLAQNLRQVFSRETLLEKVWGYEYYGDVRTVDVTVRRLREKIEDNPGKPEYIITKRGVGYSFGVN